MFAKSKHLKHSENSLYPDTEILNNTKPLVNAGGHAAPYALTAQEVLNAGQRSAETDDIPMSGAKPEISPLEALRRRAIKAANDKKEQKNPNVNGSSVPSTVNPKSFAETEKRTEKVSSLLEKCMPYINDGGEKIAEKKPDYTLESIDDIINSSETKAEELLKQLNSMGTVTFDNLSHTENPVKNENGSAEITIDNTPVSVDVEDIRMTDSYGSPITKISDIDNSGDNSKTVSFNAVSNTEYEDISSGTKILDLKNEIFDIDESEHRRISTEEVFEPEEFRVEGDYLSYSDAKRIGGDLLKNSRASGIRLILTFVLTAVLACAKIPFIHDALYTNPLFFSAISAAIFLVVCLVNYDAFAAIKTLFTPRKAPESASAIVAVATLIYSVYALVVAENPYQLILFASITFFIKCIAVSMRNTYILNNFRIIATKREKYAVKFIDDRQITFAMAKNTIEGDALIGTSVKCETVQEFLKHSYKDSVMNGIFGAFALTSVIIAAVGAIAYGIYNSSFSSCVSVFAVLIGIAFSPTIFFTDIFPLCHANAKLNKSGAMIAGAQAAKDIELANAVAATAADIFPDGTVTLYSMQSLSPNNIDTTILDAAAVAKQMNSPLFDIFNKIVKTGEKDIPIADSIKYEDRLGISGWVDNRHIFIGNRTLLEAHGIKVPSIEIDKKILRNGYFPVYVASDDKPCALLIVKYNVDEKISEEMQKLSSSGVMILIDSCDPNITGEMVCDYFGLYEGAVYIMGSSGSQLYKNATKPEDGVSAPAAYRGKSGSIFAIFNRAAKIKRTITSLSVFHIIASVIMAVIYVYSSFINGFSPLESGTIFIYTSASLVISYIITLFNK